MARPAAMQIAQRQAALAVRRVLDGATITAALAAEADASGEGRRHALVQELVYGTLRYWGRYAAVVGRLASKPLQDPALAGLLAVALYQIEFTRLPAFAAVDHAVAVAATLARPAAKGLVNAILRRYLRERDAIEAALREDPVARWSYPAWWIARVRADHPTAWETILEAGNARPPLTLRVNRRRVGRDAMIVRFAEAGIDARPMGEAGVLVGEPRPVKELPGFHEGLWSVQDAGAQLAAPLLAPRDGDRVLDACAAPGGKTTHLAELAAVDIVAIDESEARLARVRENCARLGAERVGVVTGDAGRPETWWDGRPFERILADVPCTASGVVRRHPDAKWLRRESDVEGFARQQARLLDALWPLLARGGLFLYATCSLFRRENDDQVDAFVAGHPDASRVPVDLPPPIAHRDGQLLPSLPGALHDHDGFYYALVRKA